MGRPSGYSQELADRLCEQLADGKSLRTICKSEDMPGKTTVLRWLRDNEDFRGQYARARDEQADSIADEMIDIADGGDGGDVQRDRLRVDTRKWVASVLKPKKYGDSVTHKGDAENPLHYKVTKIELTDLEGTSPTPAET